MRTLYTSWSNLTIYRVVNEGANEERDWVADVRSVTNMVAHTGCKCRAQVFHRLAQPACFTNGADDCSHLQPDSWVERPLFKSAMEIERESGLWVGLRWAVKAIFYLL